MTNELEKQFFSTFGIEPKEEKYCYWECKKPELENVACNNTECEHYRHKIHYPYISDRILLELICIVNKYLDEGFWGENMTELKEEVLNNCLLAVNTTDYGVAGYEEDVKQQVQALFEEG